MTETLAGKNPGFPPYETLLTEHRGTELHLTLNRPERRNALTHAMMLELADLVARMAAEPGLRVLVIRAAGPAFCAGGDMAAMAEQPPPAADGGPDPLVAPYRVFGDVLQNLNRLPQVVVSIVDGAAAGGGFGIACCSDVVLLGPRAKFAIPEPRAGFIPSQVIPFIVRRLGEGTARWLALTGTVMPAAEAYRLGLGQVLAADEAALEAALAEVLGQIRRQEPLANATVKDLVHACAERDTGAVLDEAAERLVGLLRRPQAAEGMQAFLDKRPPSWAR